MLRQLVVAGLFFFLAIPVSGQTDSRNNDPYYASLNHCIAQQFSKNTSPRLNKKIDLSDACPDLAQQLAKHLHEPFIQPSLENETSLNRLLDERAFIQQSYQPTDNSRIDLDLVSQLAQQFSLDSSAALEQSWWQQLKDWLKEKYGSKEEESNIDWLIELLDGFSISDKVIKIIFYGSIALIIVLAVVIIANELRHYKRYRNRDTSTTTPTSMQPLQQLRRLSWEQVLALPLQQKTAALLQYLIQQCINRKWLPDNQSYTNYEFYRRLNNTDKSKAALFKQIINAAEQDIYGKHPLEAAQIEQLIRITEQILHPDKAVEA